MDLVMARPRATFSKRQRENAKKEKRAEKAERRASRRTERDESPGDPSDASDEDPDIAGIIPGPQPIPEDAL